jgi:hypothetical protein
VRGEIVRPFKSLEGLQMYDLDRIKDKAELLSSTSQGIDINDIQEIEYGLKISRVEGSLKAFERIKPRLIALAEGSKRDGPPGLIEGTGMFIDLSCPSCRKKLSARVSLETQA